MIPEGPIYRQLRTQVLTAMPEGVKVDFRTPMPLRDWLSKGIYSVRSCDNSQVVLSASPLDLGSTLLTDIEFLVDHCFEHLNEIKCFDGEKLPRSDAWQVVTVYYFAFFVAQALLRILGRSVVFLDRDLLNSFSKQLSSGSKSPAPSSFVLEKISDISATQSEYRLKRLTKKPHEATWKELFACISELSQNTTLASDPTEAQFYDSLTTKCLFKYYTDYQWPSTIRTKANYQPGFAYKLMSGKEIAMSRTAIGDWVCSNSRELQSRLDATIRMCSGKGGAEFSGHFHLLYDISQCLFLLLRKLYFEVIRRRGADKRSEERRKKFAKLNALNPQYIGEVSI